MRRLFTAAFMCLPIAANAQMAATLLADQVTVSPDGQLTANGNVEVMFDGTHLRATSITYAQATDTLTVSGPIIIQTPDGDLFTANQAQLSPTLETGLLLSARMVLDDQLQLTAGRIDRTAGDLTQLSRVAATSCNICADRAPLWEIRADRIIHDETEQQLYLEDAVFRVRGVPVFWLPYLRMPDPSLKRATGFLVPSYKSNNLLGTGIKVPYFVRLGDHRDLTITPYISAETTTLEATYRQAFVNGDLIANAAISQDTLSDAQQRGYVDVSGDFALAGDFDLQFRAISTSDSSYLNQYDYSDADRLKSFVSIGRYRADGFTFGELAVYETTVAGETSGSLPPLVLTFSTERRTDMAGGVATTSLDADYFNRYSTDDTGNESDVLQLGLGAEWNRVWTTDLGLIAQVDTQLNADVWAISDSDNHGGGRLNPAASVTLGYPLMRTGPSGIVDVIEPVVMVGWSGNYGATAPNEDSLSAELDGANLLELSRFSGDDRIESGFQMAYGGRWTRKTANNWQARISMGQILRTNSADYSESSGLLERESAILLSGQFTTPNDVYVLGRTLINTATDRQKSEIMVGSQGDKLDLSATYVWLPADTAEGRDQDYSQWSVAADYDITDIWSVGISGRYDVAANDPVAAGLTIGWRNECVEVELSASRSYTSSSNVAPTTDISLSVGLAGFGTGTSNVASRQACRD